MFRLLLMLCLVASSAEASSLSALWKQVGRYNSADNLPSSETSIIVDQTGAINSGKPFTITFVEDGVEEAWPMNVVPNLVIRDYSSRAIIKQVPWPSGGYRGFAINQTIGGLVHIFATQDPNNTTGANAYAHATLDQNLNLGTTQIIWAGAWYGGGIKAIMGNATPNPQGGWSITYANQYGVGSLDWPDANFAPRGYTNVGIGLPFTSTLQSAEEEWANGYWYAYIQYIQNGLLWLSLARSTDRAHWTYSSTVLLYPDMPALEGIDASDPRVVEYQGTVYIIYLCGDQSTWSAIRTATFPGTLAQLRAQFF